MKEGVDGGVEGGCWMRAKNFNTYACTHRNTLFNAMLTPYVAFLVSISLNQISDGQHPHHCPLPCLAFTGLQAGLHCDCKTISSC